MGLCLHTPVFMWIKLRQIFSKRKSFNHLYGWDVLTISFLFGRMGKQNWKSSWRDSITFCRPFNLHTSHRKTRVAFLDLNVSLENGLITTDLHTKSTDFHQCFHCSSSHPDHIKNSIIYHQTLRLSKQSGKTGRTGRSWCSICYNISPSA